MSKPEVSGEGATVRVRNVGGISETTVDVPPGVTVLAGRNATNRTSFLQAIMAALGSDAASLKGDAEEGAVDLVMDGETYHRSLHRNEGTVSLRGEPYLDDSTVADLFAFLLESNEARQAVVRGDDLRELIMRPVDTDEIRNEIDRLERERDEVERELDELDSLKDDLPSLERRKRRIESEIEEKRETLAAKTEEIESMDAEIEETRQEKQELESRLTDLRELRSKLEDVRADIDLQQESLKSLRAERTELRTDREELSDEPTDERRELDRTLSELRERKQHLETRVSDLQNVIQFNEEMLNGEETVVSEAFGDGRSTDDPTDQLVEEEPVVCWTCGSEVERERIEGTLGTVRSVRKDHVEEVRDIEARLEELQSEKRERERERRRRDELDGKLADIEDEIERRESRLETLRERRDQLSADVEAVEEEIDALETADFSGILDLHKEANQLEFELGRLESDLEDVTDRIETIESQLDAEPDLEDRRDRIRNDLEIQRTRIDRIEREAVEEFNSCMEEVLELLQYDNLERIWIERVQKPDRGRGNDDRTVFQIHVVRSTDSGTSYEDTIDHLSESEREVTGLTFALAGYLVHEVHETVPFMLLDSLEAIDSARLAEFVSFFDSYAEYLVVALLPEDARALSEEYTYVTEI